MPMCRPNPVQWVWYAFGGKLPDRCGEWVLHDVTCRTWVLRHFARALVQLAPFCLILLLILPEPLWISGSAVVLGIFVGLFYSVCYMGESNEHRAIKHGHPPGFARETRALHRAVRRETRQAAREHRWRPRP